MMNIIFLGAPGVGKGTYAKELVEKYGFIQISTGDILRAEIKKNSNIGKEVSKIINEGNLVSDEIINQVVTNFIDLDKNYIFDGYPRKISQAEFLDGFLKDKGKAIDYVICFELDRDIIIKRLTGRRKCSVCGNDYNVYFNPSPNNDKCVCGSVLSQRNDDKEEVIDNRLIVYEKDTAPLIEYYEKKDILRKIDSSRGIDNVVKDIVEIIKPDFVH